VLYLEIWLRRVMQDNGAFFVAEALPEEMSQFIVRTTFCWHVTTGLFFSVFERKPTMLKFHPNPPGAVLPVKGSE